MAAFTASMLQVSTKVVVTLALAGRKSFISAQVPP
jgi:hypothetical protein